MPVEQFTLVDLAECSPEAARSPRGCQPVATLKTRVVELEDRLQRERDRTDSLMADLQAALIF